MKVLALGGYGVFGKKVARNLCSSDLVSEIAIAGRDLHEAEAFARHLGVKARGVRADASDKEGLSSLASGADLLVNIAGPDYLVSYPAAKAAIDAGADYCDLCADVAAVERLLKLDHDAKARDVTVLLGMGASPGESNLLMKHAALQMDEVDEVRVLLTYNLVDMISHMGVDDSAKAASEMRRTGRVNASWETVMNWGGGRVLVHERGEDVEVNPTERLEKIYLPGEGIATFFPIACPEAVTIPRYVKSVRSAAYMMRVSPPQISDLYLSLVNRIRKKEIGTAEATILFHESVAKEQRACAASTSRADTKTDMVVVAIGRKNGRRVRYSCRLASGWIEASSALTVAALRILGGKVKERGVLAHEACFELMEFFKEASELTSIDFDEKKLLAESLEELD